MVVNAQLKQFIAERDITFSEPLVPTPYLEKVLKKADEAERTGNYKDYSLMFTNAEDVIAWLHE